MFNKHQPSYISLRDIVTERRNRLVLWVGAGLSQPSNIPSWKELKTKLCTALEQKVDGIIPPDDELRKQLILAKSEKSLWLSFNHLQKALGQTTYQAEIKGALLPSNKLQIPENYKKLWKLNPSGIITLNLDNFLIRAHSEIRVSKVVHTFAGNNTGPYTSILQSPHPFALHLHGFLEDVTSWVFTSNELRQLVNDKAYTNFISNILTSRTVIFIGTTVEDEAVGGHLERLKADKIQVGDHYWLTDRRDLGTDRWAENNHVRLINYSSANNHAELGEILDHLATYLPKEEVAPPVSPLVEGVEKEPLPAPDELADFDENTIRQLLNAKAAKILAPCTQQSYIEYERFTEQYDRAIYRAWYIKPGVKNESFLDYTIQEKLAEGAFGKSSLLEIIQARLLP